MSSNIDDNNHRGWFRLYRSLDKWEWYKDSYTLHVFIHVLIGANHTPKKWRGNLIKRGQFLTSPEQISHETGISYQSVRTALKRLKLTNELTIKSTTKFTMITVCNYDSYQEIKVDANNQANNQTNNQANNQLTSNQRATNEQLTTTKNDNNYKELNNNIYKEIFKNSEIYFDTLSEKHDLSLDNNYKNFKEFFNLNYAEKKEHFSSYDVKNHYQHRLPKMIEKKIKKPSKKMINNRPKK